MATEASAGGHNRAITFDGAFAPYVWVPDSEAFTVDCDWSDAELASISCAYGTAENMAQRARVSGGDRVLVPGASGGVGSALVKLLKRRGAEVIAVSIPAKNEAMRTGVADVHPPVGGSSLARAPSLTCRRAANRDEAASHRMAPSRADRWCGHVPGGCSSDQTDIQSSSSTYSP